MKWTRFIALVGRHRFPFAIGSVICVALLMTAVSMSLYVSSGASRLDLSRPGFEQARKGIKQTPDDKFNSDGKVDSATVDEFEKLYQKQRVYLNNLGDFKDTSLDDPSLRLSSDAPSQN
jgi:hypothetical protein